jgi:hypothetical protein
MSCAAPVTKLGGAVRESRGDLVAMDNTLRKSGPSPSSWRNPLSTRDAGGEGRGEGGRDAGRRPFDEPLVVGASPA